MVQKKPYRMWWTAWSTTESYLSIPLHVHHKTFSFGGDASRQADWSASWWMAQRPLLVGRRILQAFERPDELQGWQDVDVPLGERGKYLLQLDDLVEYDSEGNI